ncbi:hypothetical protein Lser_V15G00862 [Lactuca serriola]
MQTEVGYRSWRSSSAEGGIAGRKGCIGDLFSFVVRLVSTHEGGERNFVLCLCLLEKRNLVGSSYKGGSVVLVDRYFFFSGELCQQGIHGCLFLVFLTGNECRCVLTIQPTFVFVVDGSSSEDELQALENELLLIVAELQENAMVGLIVFDSMVRLYDLGFTECLWVVFLHGERKTSSSQCFEEANIDVEKEENIENESVLYQNVLCYNV